MEALRKSLTSALFGLLGSFFLASGCHAATLNFSPSTGTETVNASFTVDATLDTAGAIANAVDTTIIFPADKLQVTNVSTSNSVLKLWVQAPTWSNSSGTISFTAGTPRPAFTGSSLNLVSITFKPIAQGNASLSYSFGSVLSGDGNATELFTGSGTASFTINPAPPPPPPPPPAPAPAPTIIYVPVPAPAPAPAPVTPVEPLVCPPTGGSSVTPENPTTPTTPEETPAPQNPPVTVTQEKPVEQPVAFTEAPVQAVVQTVAPAVKTVTRQVVKFQESILPARQSESVQVSASTATAAFGAAAEAQVVTLASGFGLPAYLHYLLVAPVLLLQRKRGRKGTVYNADTKLPVDLATLCIYRVSDGQLVKTLVTNLRGEFFFSLPKGIYRMTAQKHGFIMAPQTYDITRDSFIFPGVYTGGTLTVGDHDQKLAISIPLLETTSGSPMTFSRLKRRELLRKMQWTVGILGVIAAMGMFILNPGTATAGLLVAQSSILALVKRLAIPHMPKDWGTVYDEHTGKPLRHAVVSVQDAGTGKVLETCLTDRRGRYFFMLGPSTFSVTYEKDGYERMEITPVDFTHSKHEQFLRLNVSLSKTL